MSAETLNPMQMAVISAIEDARVETLSIRRFPGLKQLWSKLHVATPALNKRWPYSLHIKNVPFRVMSTTVRQALGDRSSVGEGKFAAALLTRTPGKPKRSSI